MTTALVWKALRRSRGEIAPGDVAVEEERHADPVDDRDCGRLGRREVARPDPPDDDDRHQDRRSCGLERAPDLGARGALRARVAAGLFPVPDADGHERRGRDEGGDDARHRQRPHRHAGDEGVDEERDRERHQERERPGDREQRGRERARVAALDHGRDDQRADRRSVGDRRSRHAAEHQARGDGDDAESPRQKTEQHPRELDDALADAAVGQELAGEDEERHRDQDERLDSADVAEEDRLERVREALRPDHADRRDEQGVHQRHARERDHEEGDEDVDREHRLCAVALRRRPAADDLNEVPGDEDERRRRARRQREVLPRHWPVEHRQDVAAARRHDAEAEPDQQSQDEQRERLNGCVRPAAGQPGELVEELRDAHVRAAARRRRAAEESHPDHHEFTELGGPGDVAPEDVEDDVDEDERDHRRAERDHRPVDGCAEDPDRQRRRRTGGKQGAARRAPRPFGFERCAHRSITSAGHLAGIALRILAASART